MFFPEFAVFHKGMSPIPAYIFRFLPLSCSEYEHLHTPDWLSAPMQEIPKLLWVVGYRISEHYKVTSQTKQILKVQVKGVEENE